MKFPTRILLAICIVLACATTAYTQDVSPVLATNSWTAAFVEMAGGTAEQLAPNSMEHPPEYELKPSDVIKVKNAALLVFAGYEVLMQTVFESFDKPENQLLKITTGYAPDIVEKSVLAIAGRLNTLEEAGRNLTLYKEQIATLTTQLKDKGLYGKQVVVNFHQKALIEALGFSVAGVFGPQPLSANQILQLGKIKPDLVIDNIHNPLAAPLEEIYDKHAVMLMNFPGYPTGDVPTKTLSDVLQYNGNQLMFGR